MCDSPKVDLICGSATFIAAKSNPSEKHAAPSRNSSRWCAAVSPPAPGAAAAGSATSSPTREPVRDQPVRDRGRRWQARSPLLVAPELVAGEPAHVLELIVGDVRLTGDHPCLEAEHQRRRERPGLAAAVDDVADDDAGLLPNLSHYRVLQRLSGLDETCQRGVAPARPRRLAAEQAPVIAVVHEHDDRRVGAREV